MSKKLVIIPTFNEKENIKNIIDVVLALPIQVHILIVDDNSPDGTADIVKNLQTQYQESLFIVERKGKLGLGTAYIAGFKYALDNGYDYIFEMDADFSHPPKQLAALLQICESKEADMAVGSRYIKGGGIENWTWDRHFLSYGASLYVRLISSLGVMDATAGFVCYHRDVLSAMDFSKIKFIGYAFQIEMKYYTKCLGFTIKESPITFKDRELGTSKMNMSIVSEAILGVLKMRMRPYKSWDSRKK